MKRTSVAPPTVLGPPGNPNGPRLPLSARPLTIMVAAVGVALLATGCGGHSSQGGSDGASTSSRLLAYAQCMRAHGVPNFPDPDRSGLIPADQVKSLTVSRAVFAVADGHCHHLYPTLPGINAPFSAQQKQDYLSAAACMRVHGIPNFPDPVFSRSHVQIPLPAGIDPNSAQFTQARQVCARMIPAGLPYSGNSE
jgi:hypothetical protein